MMDFKIKIPSSLMDYRLKHFKAFSDLVNDGIIDKVVFLANLTDVAVSKIRMLNEKEINKIISLSVASFSKYKYSDPKKEITINGKQYTLVNPDKASMGWHLDVKELDVMKDHAKLCAMMYIEKGTSYCEVDEHDNVIHPNAVREQEFKDHFPLPLYLDLRAFFLFKLIKSTRTSIVQRLVSLSTEKMIKKWKNRRYLKSKSQ